MPDRVGVQLAADDAAKYFATLDRVNKVTDILIGTTRDLVGTLGLLEKEEDQAGKSAKGLGDDVEHSSKKLGLLEQATIGATRRLGEFAVDGARMAAQAVLDFTKDGVKAAGDFESGMNSFQAVVGDSLEGSGQSVNDFKQLFISLGRDLPVSTAEVQQAAIEMAKGGIEPATIAAGGLKQTLQFAAASGLGLADAATIAAKTIGGWAAVNATAAEKAALLAHSTDLLARAANASTVDVDELALGLYNVQGTAKASGVTLDETVTTLALLAPNFNSSAEAGNAMKNMLLRLQPATDPAAASMKKLGLLTKDGNSVFYDAEGHFIGMRATADKLHKALGGLSEAQKTEALRTIFGNDALNAANTLLSQGADGYDAMAASMAKQLGVAEQARLKQQGFNTAVDNLLGSLEALQITVFSRALPALTGLVNLLAKGINVITDYAEATANGETVLSSIISVIQTGAVPALLGLTTALTAYAIVQVVQATPAILASLPAIAAQTAAFIANAAAIMAAIAPYALIGAAVAGVAYAWNDFSAKVETATQQMLEGKQFWTDSAAAIENFGNASDETQQRLKPLADSIAMQRDLLEQQIESLGKRQAAGLVTEEQFAAEMDQLNGMATAITFASDQLNAQIDAEARAAAASMTATSEAANLEGATAELGGQAALTAKDIEDLGKKIQDTYQKGQEAVQAYATNQSTFLSGVEERAQTHADQIAKLEAQKAKATTEEQKKGIDEQIAQAEQGYRDQEAKAAESYARQQAEQQQHLGQMLIDYTVAQASLGNIGKDKAAEITGALEKAYGLQETSTASTFLRMAGSIDQFSKDSGGSIDGLIGKLKDQQQQAADTQKAEDQYYHDSAAAAAQTFTEKGGDVQAYVAELEKIPLEASTAIELPEINKRNQEVLNIHQSLDQLPTEVSIHIKVKDDRPPDLIAHSPLPFTIALDGAIDTMKQFGAVGSQALSAINRGATQNGGSVADAVHDLMDTIATSAYAPVELGEAFDELAQALGVNEDAFDRLQTALTQTGPASQESVDALLELQRELGLTDEQTEVLSASLGMLGAGTQGSVSTLNAYGEQVLATWTGVASNVAEMVTNSDLPGSAEEMGVNTLQGFVSGLESELRNAQRVVDKIVSGIEKQFESGLDISSPSGVTEEIGTNVMLGLLNGLDDMLPDLLSNIDRITGAINIRIGEIDEQLKGKLTDDARKALEDERDRLLEEIDTIASTVSDLPSLLNDALANAYSSSADFWRQQADNLQAVFDIGRDPGDTARLGEQLAEKQARLADIRAGRLLVNDQERVKLEQEVADLQQQQADAQKAQQQRLDLQKRTQDAIARATEEASGMEDPAKAAAFLKLRTDQILKLAELEQRRAAATDPAEQALIDQQIELEKKAQEADLQAFDLQKDQIGAMQDLVSALQTLNDNISLGDDLPPELVQFFQALTLLTSQLDDIGALAGGGAMQAMQPYLVGERGPELVIPSANSTVLNALDTRRALGPPSVGGGTSTVYGGSTIVNVDARGSSLSEGQITQAVWAGISAASNGADVRVRMGVG